MSSTANNINRRKILFNRQKGECHWCGQAMTRDTVNYDGVPPDHTMCTIDHIVPRSMGGSNRWENIVAACWLCNNLRSSTDPVTTVEILPNRRRKYLAKWEKEKEKEKKNGSVGNSG